jgi:hypothetical protein
MQRRSVAAVWSSLAVFPFQSRKNVLIKVHVNVSFKVDVPFQIRAASSCSFNENL